MQVHYHNLVCRRKRIINPPRKKKKKRTATYLRSRENDPIHRVHQKHIGDSNELRFLRVVNEFKSRWPKYLTEVVRSTPDEDRSLKADAWAVLSNGKSIAVQVKSSDHYLSEFIAENRGYVYVGIVVNERKDPNSIFKRFLYRLDIAVRRLYPEVLR